MFEKKNRTHLGSKKKCTLTGGDVLKSFLQLKSLYVIVSFSQNNIKTFK